MALKRRLQFLLAELRSRRVAAAARRGQTSVAAVIRDAIGEALPADRERKRVAADALLAAEPTPVPGTVEELKAELGAARTRDP
jgi:hypothetical protein